MKFLASGKTGRILQAISLVLAIAMIVVGTALSFRNSELAVYLGVALFLAAGAPAFGGFGPRFQSEDGILQRKASSKKISSGLIALSSAAILVVYGAGYDRTSSAAERFDEQTAAPRRRPAPVGAAIARTAPPAIGKTAPVPASGLPETTNVVAANTITPVSSLRSDPAPDRAPLPAPASTEASPAAVVAPVEPAQTQAPVATPVATPVPQAQQDEYVWEYADGAYWGWGSCRHGDLQVQVVIQDGKIFSADITKCLTRYSCQIIKDAPPQVVSRQDPERIDNVSGATQSINAYYDAVLDALDKAVK